MGKKIDIDSAFCFCSKNTCAKCIVYALEICEPLSIRRSVNRQSLLSQAKLFPNLFCRQKQFFTSVGCTHTKTLQQYFLRWSTKTAYGAIHVHVFHEKKNETHVKGVPSKVHGHTHMSNCCGTTHFQNNCLTKFNQNHVGFLFGAFSLHNNCIVFKIHCHYHYH